MIIRNLGVALLAKQGLINEREEGIEACMHFPITTSHYQPTVQYKKKKTKEHYSLHCFQCQYCGKKIKRLYVEGFETGKIKYCSPECKREAQIIKRFGRT